MAENEDPGRDITVLAVGVTGWVGLTWWVVKQLEPLAVLAVLEGNPPSGKTIERGPFESAPAEAVVLFGLVLSLYLFVVHLSKEAQRPE